MSHEDMACDELVELVTAYLDGSLDPDTRVRFDEHLLECDGCASYLQQFRSTVATLGAVGDEEIEPGFRRKLLDAFKNWH
ncbi:zf-HC2 domain-containing protein [Mycolicibacterium hippocampi]|uniref:Anti-sigma factor n=2 Tax=Mycolicibacterium hippocampi TaxID=659824 RepID=A0A7I9ZKE8_9MYCO|nr:anti-sigma factor [Mycolicibacterium hippocampi]